MDILLKPIINQIKHILKNSTQVITELEAISFPTNSILVSADVSSLYPSIYIYTHRWSINVILSFIKDYKDPTYPPIIFIKNVLNYILKYNCFNFADLFFLQVRGIAMGTKTAPNYANLFMADFERRMFLITRSNPYITDAT